MARDLNHAILVGRLTRDVEVKYTQSGTAMTKLSIANGDRVKKNGEWVDETSFFDVTVFGNQAENCGKYLKKGSQIGVEGRLRQNKWQDKEGNNRYSIEIVASAIQFLTQKESTDKTSEMPDPYQNNNDDDIPF